MSATDTFPVAPGRRPVLGHLWPLYRDAHRFLERTRDQLGPLFCVDSGTNFRMLVVDGEPGFELYRTRDASSGHLVQGFEGLLGGSLLVKDGAEHRRMRGAMNPAFTPNGLSAAAAGEQIAGILVPRVERLVVAGPCDIVRETREAALDVIFAMLGIETAELPRWRHQYEEFSWLAVNLPMRFPGSPAWRGHRGRDWIDTRMRRMIAAARADENDRSLLAAIVRGRDDEGQGLSDDELVDNLRLLALAGHETTASTIAWSILHLAIDETSWQRLVAEAMGAEGPPVQPAEIADFPFTTAIFREALRLHPPISMDSRRIDVEMELHGRTVPAGTIAGIPLTLLSRDPVHYPEPECFRPERFSEAGRRPTPLEMCQFGAGVHFCLGYHVAMLEGVQYLVAFARSCAERGLAPRSADGKLAPSRYLPFTKPHATKLELRRQGPSERAG